MKKKVSKYPVLLFTVLSLTQCVGSSKDKTVKSDGIAEADTTIGCFQNKKHDFGIINTDKNEFVAYNFHFTNEEETPLIIYKADVSCSCLATEIPKQPIKKGEGGNIKVTVDTRKLSGYFNKSVFVKSNSEKEDVILLRVEGTVK